MAAQEYSKEEIDPVRIARIELLAETNHTKLLFSCWNMERTRLSHLWLIKKVSKFNDKNMTNRQVMGLIKVNKGKGTLDYDLDYPSTEAFLYEEMKMKNEITTLLFSVVI